MREKSKKGVEKWGEKPNNKKKKALVYYYFLQ